MSISKPRLFASVGFLFLAGVCTALPPVRAQDAAPSTQPAGKATLTVTVVDASGAPVEGARVMLLAPTTAPAGDAAAARGSRPKPLARGTTDSSGKAVLSDIADGDYSVVARLRGKGNGRASVTVVASADADVSVTLKAGKHRGAAGDKPATQPAGA